MAFNNMGNPNSCIYQLTILQLGSLLNLGIKFAFKGKVQTLNGPNSFSQISSFRIKCMNLFSCVISLSGKIFS